jgi:regulatory protein
MPFANSGGQRGRQYEPPPPVDPDDREAAATMAQRLLAVTDRSRVELQRRLERRGYAPETASEAVEHLQARGWVDDNRLAEDLARRRLSHGYGRRRVVADLVSRGVDAETVNRTAAALGEGQAGAVRIAADRLRRGHAGLLTDAEVRRLAAALQRRGFDMADIRAVLRQMATESVALAPDEGGPAALDRSAGQVRRCRPQPAQAAGDVTVPRRSQRSTGPSSTNVYTASRNPKTTSPSKDARLTATPPRAAPIAPPAARVTV